MTSSRPTSRSLTPLLVGLGLALATTGCAIPQLSITPRIAASSLDGKFLATDAANAGTSAESDLESMGLDDNEARPGLRVDLKLGTPHVVLYGSQVSFSGRGTVDGQIRLQNQTFFSNTGVDTDFDLGQYTGLLLFDVLPTKSFDLGIGVGLTVLDFDLQLESLGPAPPVGTMVSTDELLPIPVLAANGAVNVGPVDVSLLLSGMSVSVSDFDGTLLDADANVRWKFLGGKNHLRAALLLGWRQTDMDFEYDDGDDQVDADLSLSGPYLGLQLTL